MKKNKKDLQFKIEIENNKALLQNLAFIANEKLMFPNTDDKYLLNYSVEIRPIKVTSDGDRQVTIIRASCFDKTHGEESKWEGPLEEWYDACAKIVRANKITKY
jgi:hypothetical protein